MPDLQAQKQLRTANLFLNEYTKNFFGAIPTLNDDTLPLFYQQLFIDKLLSITENFNHVLYTINNESNVPHEAIKYWANYFQTNTLQNIYVADMRRYHPPSYSSSIFQDINDPENYEPINNPAIFNYLDISQNGGNFGQTHYDNLIWYRSQVQ